MRAIVRIYARRINEGKMTIDQVREHDREEVRAAVKELYGKEV